MPLAKHSPAHMLLLTYNPGPVALAQPMHPNLYKRLGCSPKATLSELISAYKAVLRHYHPDRMGIVALVDNPNELKYRQDCCSNLHIAHFVLVESNQRKIYTRTKVYIPSQTSVDHEARSRIMTTLTGVIDQIVGNDEVDPTTIDIEAKVRQAFVGGVSQCEQKFAQIERQLAKLERTLKLAHKKRRQGNMFAILLKQRIKVLKTELGKFHCEHIISKRAISLVKESVHFANEKQVQVIRPSRSDYHHFTSTGWGR